MLANNALSRVRPESAGVAVEDPSKPLSKVLSESKRKSKMLGRYETGTFNTSRRCVVQAVF